MAEVRRLIWVTALTVALLLLGGTVVSAAAQERGSHMVGVASQTANAEQAELVTPPGRPTGQDRPGWGCGDENHNHTGPPGNPGASSPCDKSGHP